MSKLKWFLVQALLWVCCTDRTLAAGPGYNTGIEGFDSQRWSVGIFVFLMFCIIVYTVIVLKFMTSEPDTKMRRGEMLLFGWILFGVVAAVIIGAMQLLQGRLL